MSDSMPVQRPALPAAVRRAVFLIVISMVPGAVDLVRGVHPPNPGQPTWFAPVVGAFTLAIILALALLIWQGRGWARVVYAVLYGLGVPMMIAVASQLSAWLADRPARAVLLLLQSASGLVALALLFLPEANTWFRATKLARKSA